MLFADGNQIFCIECGSPYLEVKRQEEITGKMQDLVHCKVCNHYYTFDFIEDNIEMFLEKRPRFIRE